MSEHVARSAGGVTVIDVADSYSRETFLKLMDLAKKATAKGSSRILLNMAKLPQVDSQGIGLLVLVHDHCESAGGRLVLCSLSKMVERVLKLAGVLTFFKVYPDQRSGVAALAEAAKAAAAPSGEEEPAAPEPATVAPEDLAAAAREIVQNVIRSRRHHEVIGFFARRTIKVASLDEIAGSLGIARETAELVMRDLAGNEIVVEDGEVFMWHPSPEAERKLALFCRALAAPKLRTRVLAWLYAEEKK